MELQQQAALLRRYLIRRTHSPPSPTSQALDQLVKGCEMAMSSAVLLASENEKLRAENERQKVKRSKPRKYIARKGVLTGAEGISRMHTAENERAKRGEASTDVSGEKLQRAAPKCSMCSALEHTAHTCPTHQTSV